MLYEFLVASPLIMLLGISLEARLTSPSFEPYSYSAIAQHHILSYRPFVARAKHLRRNGNLETEELARRLAQDWIAAWNRGDLRPLEMQNIYDSSRDGIKGQISESVDRVVASLAGSAKRQWETDPEASLRDLEMGLAVLGTVKYFDVHSVGYVSMRERALLAQLHDQAGRLDGRQRNRVCRLLERIDHDPAKLDELVHDADNLYVLDGTRWGEERSKILDPLSKIHSSGRNRPGPLRSFRVASLDYKMSTQVSSIAYARTSFQAQREAIRKVRNSVESAGTKAE